MLATQRCYWWPHDHSIWNNNHLANMWSAKPSHHVHMKQNQMILFNICLILCTLSSKTRIIVDIIVSKWTWIYFFLLKIDYVVAILWTKLCSISFTMSSQSMWEFGIFYFFFGSIITKTNGYLIWRNWSCDYSSWSWLAELDISQVSRLLIILVGKSVKSWLYQFFHWSSFCYCN